MNQKSYPQTSRRFFVESTKITSLISLAHLYSHFFFFILPPLFPLLRDELSVTYTDLGLLIVLFNVVSALTQLPMGILVDRLDAPKLLTAAVAIQGLSLIVIGLAPSYWIIMLMMIPAGLANAVYHPADYSILNRSVDSKVMGKAFSLHTVSGFAGSAIAPLTMVFLAQTVGWHWAVMLIGVFGLITALVLSKNSDLLNIKDPIAEDAETIPEKYSMRSTALLLCSLPILLRFGFWLLISIAHNGVSYFSVSSFDQMYDMPLTRANFALTIFLAASSAGILVGGYIADKKIRHDFIAMVGTIISGLAILSIALFVTGFYGIIAAMCLAGFAGGIIAPSRDLLIRSVTPEAYMGTVFGFVSTGLNLGGMLAPLAFGWLLDGGNAATVFLIAGVSQIAIIFTIYGIKASDERSQSKSYD